MRPSPTSEPRTSSVPEPLDRPMLELWLFLILAGPAAGLRTYERWIANEPA